MRVMCIGRHQFLSDHLCRFFGDAGASCQSLVGAAEASATARAFAPQAIIIESLLLSSTLLGSWARDHVLCDIPVLAVSLGNRVDDVLSIEPAGIAGIVYLPRLSKHDAYILLANLCSPHGLGIPQYGPALAQTPREVVAC